MCVFDPMPVSDMLDILHWSVADLAHEMGISLRAAQRFGSGQNMMSNEEHGWLLDLALYHVERPAPRQAA